VPIHYQWVRTRLGRLLVLGDSRAVTQLQFEDAAHCASPGTDWQRGGMVIKEAARELRAYLRGELRRFRVPVKPAGTPFQQRVWAELRRIPYASTVSYAELAARIGNPGAARAVGGAARANPICIIIPCHRVLGSTGALTGFSAGLHRKAQLLDLERRHSG
jgi:methylated-DNA-[protein]-cysteine S-methyltransferase